MARGKYKRTGTDPSGLRARGAAPSSLVVSTTAVPAKRLRVTGGAGVGEAPLLGAAVMSPWGWRVMAVFAMVGTGVCLTFYLDSRLLFGAMWTIIAGAWSAFAVFLWRKHLAWDRR
jgi:hypothetical protein